MESFGIHPMSCVDVVYKWKFNSLNDAMQAAEELCKKHHIEVNVFQIFGTYKPSAVWIAESVKP